MICNMWVDIMIVAAVKLINRIGAVADVNAIAGFIEHAVILVRYVSLLLVIRRDLLFTSPLLVKAKVTIFYDGK